MKIKNALVYTKDGLFEAGDLCFDGAVITDSSADDAVYDADGLYAIPGLTDVHLHGAMGYDFCDGTPEALTAIAQYEAKNGITSFTPASMTFSEEILSGIFENARNFECEKGAMLMGINMEGPFLSYAKRGAQNPKYLCDTDADMFRRLNSLSGDQIKLVTIAPEEPGALDFIKDVHDEVVVSLGHTCASYDTATAAFEAGAKHVTHLYNAMPPFGHREPGLIGAAADDETVCAELITDGIHSHPAAVRIAFKLFGAHRLCLISDTMMAAGLDDGDYTLGGQAVKVNGKKATLADGTIAGSVTNAMDCLRTAVSFGIPLEDAIWAATATPAQVIGAFDTIGSLETGKLANIVLLDKELNIRQVFVKGQPIL